MLQILALLACIVTVALAGCDKTQNVTCGEGTSLVDGRCMCDSAVAGGSAKSASEAGLAAAAPEKAGASACLEGQVIVPKEMDAMEIASSFYADVMPEAIETQVYKSDVDLKVLAATTTEFYGKTLELTGDLDLNSDYGGKYDGQKATHYSFLFRGKGGELMVYGEKSKFKWLFKLIIEDDFSGPFGVRVITDKSHEWDNVFTLIEAEPKTAWMRGRCADTKSK